MPELQNSGVGPWTKYQKAPGVLPAPGPAGAPAGQARRVINFEGRRITVPGDATDAEIAQILGGSGAPAAPAAGMFDDLIPKAPGGTASTAPAGLFDDLIPTPGKAAPAAGQEGPWTKYQRAAPGAPAAPSERTFNFQGRQITVPADATDQEIADILSGQGPAGKSADPSNPENDVPGLAKRAASSVLWPLTAAGEVAGALMNNPTENTYLGQRADRGIADTIGAPVDLAALGMNLGAFGVDKVAELFGGNMDYRVEKPFMGSDWIADQTANAYQNLGGTVVKPDAVSPGVRMAGEALRSGTSAALGGGALASAPAQVAARSGGTIGRLIEPLAAPYKDSARALAGDVSAGAASGAAANAYNEHMPDGVKDFLGPLGPIAAAIAGGATGATVHSVASGLGSLAQNTAQRVVAGRADPMGPVTPSTGRQATPAEMDAAARAVQVQASNPAVAARNIEDASTDALQSVRPGEVPTTGAMSGDVGLTLLEREARARNPRPFIERDQATNAAAGEVARSIVPPGAAARDFTDTADAFQRQRTMDAQANVATARAAESDLANVLRKQAEPVAAAAGQGVPASQRLDDAIVGGSLRPMQERKNTAFESIDPNRTVARDASPLIQAAANIRDSLGRLNDPSSILPTRTLDRIDALSVEAGGSGSIAYGELNALRPELSSALVKARAAGDFALADNIQRLQGAINRETDRLAAEATPAGARAAEAQRIYRDEFSPVWSVGPGDEATRFRRDVNADRSARTQSPPSATAARFLRPGQPEKAASLARILETLPDKAAAQGEARRYLVSDLAESGVLDAGKGQLRPNALRRWRNSWGDVLDTVPGLKTEVDDMLRSADAGAMKAGHLGRDIRAAEAKLDDVTKNRGALGLVLGKDPVNAVASVFNSGDPERAMRAIVAQTGTNKRAADGLKASVVDYLSANATQSALHKTADGSRPVDFAKLENLFNRHEKTLAAVLSPEEMNKLRQVHKLLSPQNALNQPGMTPLAVGDAKKSEQAWRLLEGGLKVHYGMLKGGGVLRTIKILIATLPNSDEAIQNVVLRMHFDPELAKHLLTREVEARGPEWNAKLNRLLAAASGSKESDPVPTR